MDLRRTFRLCFAATGALDLAKDESANIAAFMHSSFDHILLNVCGALRANA